MRRNVNPSTLREMSGADGNFLRRLHPMSLDRPWMMDEKPLTFLGQSALDATKNKRRLLKIPSRSASVRLRRDLYAFCILKFMSIYQVDYEMDTYVFHLNDHIRRAYNKKIPRQPLRYISGSCYHDHLRNYYMNTTRGHLQSGRIKLRHFVDINPNDFH